MSCPKLSESDLHARGLTSTTPISGRGSEQEIMRAGVPDTMQNGGSSFKCRGIKMKYSTSVATWHGGMASMSTSRGKPRLRLEDVFLLDSPGATRFYWGEVKFEGALENNASR